MGSVKEFRNIPVINWRFLLKFIWNGKRFHDRGQQAQRSIDRDLVELAGNDGVLNEELERHDFEGVFVGGFEDNGAGCSSLLHLQPSRGTDAPAIAGLQAFKAKLRHGGAQVITECL